MEGTSRSKRPIVAMVFAGLAALLIVVIVQALMRHSQIGADEDVFRTVDALFTAINSRDVPRMGDCEHRLQAYRAEKRLPAAAADHLDSIIQLARSGKWEASARKLYDFMLAQRGLP